MPTSTEVFRGGDWEMSIPVETASVRPAVPEWHSLRLFGRGRHPNTFAAGAETHD